MVDVLVIGGGNAALCAALTAREAGASVMLLEAAPREWRGGNSIHTRNLRCMHDAPQDVLTEAYPEEEFWQDLRKVTAGKTDEHHARTVIRESSQCRDQPGHDDDRWTLWRRRFHHATFYGFMLCFAATSVATLYHYLLGLPAPYSMTSLPVLLGTVGGIGLLIGPAGLWVLHLRRHPLHGDPAQKPMDLGFIALLFWTSLTGLALLLWRDTGAMALLLAVHLGIVMALFLTLPYGKFAHGVFRCAALLKWSIERRQPSRLQLAPD